MGGGICLAGAAEREVRSRDEMVQVLEQGTLLRATGECAAQGWEGTAARAHMPPPPAACTPADAKPCAARL